MIFECNYTNALVGVAGFVFTALFLYPLFEFSVYRFKVLTNGKLGVKMPVVFWNMPCGIPWLQSMRRADVTHSVPQAIESVTKERVNTVYQQVPGRFIMWTVEPENVKSVLATKFKDYGFGLRTPQMLPLLGEGIFTLDGAGWSHSRAMLRPQFSREQVSHVTTIETHVQKLISLLKQDKFIDIQQLFFKLTIDTASEFLFGESVCSLSGGNPKIPLSNGFSDAFNDSQEMLASRARAQVFYPFVTNKKFKEDCRICHLFTDSFVELALERTKVKTDEKASSYIFLDELAKETRDPLTLRNQALNILLAGRDTTASLLSFVFYTLSGHPEVYAKLREEIFSSFGEGIDEISFESLKRCTYLKYVINETLRLYPTVPFNSRTAIRDTVLPRGGGPDGASPIFIPKGTYVGYSVFAIHRLPEFWGPDANEFRPERWAEQRPDAHAWDFLPFNGGPRICLGQQFALTEASYAIVRILQTFESMSSPEGFLKKTPPFICTMTMAVKGEVLVKMKQ